MAALGDITEADQAATRQLATGHELADDELIALAHNLLGMVAWARGDPRALEHHAAALRHARWADEPWPLVLITALAGRAAHATGDHDRGDGLLPEAIRLAVDSDRFRRQSPMWYDGLRGENRKWDLRAGSTPRNIRLRL